MCGIIAYLSKNKDAIQYLLYGLQILESRGYDSAGIATILNTSSDNNIKQNQLVVTKFASTKTTNDSLYKLTASQHEHINNNVGIGHTRWATHGPKTDINAHPHIDIQQRLAIVHNGIIDNMTSLKKFLLDKNIKCVSQTDTEVIVQLISYYLHDIEHNSEYNNTSNTSDNVLDAFTTVLNKLEGTWGLVLMDKDHPDRLYASCKGSPLLLGIGDDEMFIASEISAFSKYTNNYMALDDGELITVTLDNIDMNLNSYQYVQRIKLIETEHIELSPEPYQHWTLKEIFEQDQSCLKATNNGSRLSGNNMVKLGGLNNIHKPTNLTFIGCGTSYYSGLLAKLLVEQGNCIEQVNVIDAADINQYNLPKAKNSLLVAISQSGETRDVQQAVLLAQQYNVNCIAVVNSVGSLISRTVKQGIYIHAGRENSVASTKAFTAQVTVLAQMAVYFNQDNQTYCKSIINSIRRLPLIIMQTLKLHPTCKLIAHQLIDCSNMFILGRGLGYPIAMEGALKIKEITYTHAEGYSGGSLKHGPLALLCDGFPVIVILLDDEYAKLQCCAIREIMARDATVHVITNNNDLVPEINGTTILVPNNNLLTCLNCVIILQLIAYELSILRGINPDRPRGLAKAVTVD